MRMLSQAPGADDNVPGEQMKAIAHERRRFCYPRIKSGDRLYVLLRG
jgi:hypothetical protein